MTETELRFWLAAITVGVWLVAVTLGIALYFGHRAEYAEPQTPLPPPEKPQHHWKGRPGS